MLDLVWHGNGKSGLFVRCFSLSLFCSSFARFEFNVFFVLCFVVAFSCGVDRMFSAAGEIHWDPLFSAAGGIRLDPLFSFAFRCGRDPLGSAVFHCGRDLLGSAVFRCGRDPLGSHSEAKVPALEPCLK